MYWKNQQPYFSRELKAGLFIGGESGIRAFGITGGGAGGAGLTWDLGTTVWRTY